MEKDSKQDASLVEGIFRRRIARAIRYALVRISKDEALRGKFIGTIALDELKVAYAIASGKTILEVATEFSLVEVYDYSHDEAAFAQFKQAGLTARARSL